MEYRFIAFLLKCVVITTLLQTTQGLADEDPAAFRQIVADEVARYDNGGTAALDARFADTAPEKAMVIYNDIIRYLYWNRFDIDSVVSLSEHAIDWGNIQLESADEKTKENITSRIRAIHFNLASFTWPGWGGGKQPITLTPENRKAGLNAARRNVEIHQQLKSPGKKMGNGLWMLGAHELAAGNHAVARQTFQQFLTLAKKEDVDQARFAEGWLYVVDLLTGVNEAASRKSLDEIVVKLSETKEGKFFADQYGRALNALAQTPCETVLFCKNEICSCQLKFR